MNLFIDAVSSNGVLILFDKDRQILNKKNIKVLANESSKLGFLIDSFLKENRQEYNNIENIVVVNGPGSFTGIRAIVLIANTINFIINKNITPLSFFDLFSDYPIIKSSSKRDLFVKKEKNSKIEIMTNEDFLNFIQKLKIQKIYGDLSDNLPFTEANNLINYEYIIKSLKFSDNKIIEPLYIKKPNIS